MLSQPIRISLYPRFEPAFVFLPLDMEGDLELQTLKIGRATSRPSLDKQASSTKFGVNIIT
jgi:hypothetical protein